MSTPTKASRAKRKTGPIEFAKTICDTLKNGVPDLYNSVPKRVILREEADSYGWPHYWDGKTSCKQGHVAARYVSNTAICIDCKRIGDGKVAIYPKAGILDLVTEQKPFVEPIAESYFEWNDEKRRLLFVAYVNSGNLIKSLGVINAQPYHLIAELKKNPSFRAEFDAVKLDVEQVYLWMAEGSAANGNERSLLQMASSKFPDQFGQRSKVDLNVNQQMNPGALRAEIANLLSTIGRAGVRTIGPADVVDGEYSVIEPAGAIEAPPAVGEQGLLDQPHEFSDLVS